MGNITSDILNIEKLSQQAASVSFEQRGKKPGGITRRLAEPRLKARKVKGYTYYTYCRGTDQEIYLGTAQMILKAVMDLKSAGGG